jgi:hypothetical protein
MFVGHAALALAGKTRAPSLSLGWLFAAAFGLDLAWPVFLLLGIERVSIPSRRLGFSVLTFDSYPWSHSLLLAVVWSGVGLGLARWRGCRTPIPFLLAALVFSHWVLDFVSHLPDLPLWPGRSPLVGLGLWQSMGATLLVEGTLYVAGSVLYFRTTRPRDAIGRYALPALLALFAIMWASTPFGPPPPSPQILAWSALGLYLFVLWAGWADGHRVPRTALDGGTAPRR